MDTILDRLVAEAKKHHPDLMFRVLEIGALDVGEKEGFYRVLSDFPGSQIFGFEVDESVCEDMNTRAPDGLRYFPSALGTTEETRPFFVTNHPMCSSLYEPNEPYLQLFNNLEVAYTKHKSELDTQSVDAFLASNALPCIDFVKIDIQGAELDVFKGAKSALESVLMIVTEVEFVRLYKDQPLFGDVCQFLEQHGLMFHKFLGLAGRTLRPIVLNNNKNHASQHMWSDAIFVKNILNAEHLSSEQLFKLSYLAAIYGSLDFSFFFLRQHDLRFGTQSVNAFQLQNTPA